MKILNPRVGMLSNYEVLAHITAMKTRYTALHLAAGSGVAMKAENLETVLREVKEYLELTPAATQTPENINDFMSAMSDYPLEKAELLQICNERPEVIAELDCIIEEMDTRFSEDQQLEMLEIVKANLPPKPQEALVVNGD